MKYSIQLGDYVTQALSEWDLYSTDQERVEALLSFSDDLTEPDARLAVERAGKLAETRDRNMDARAAAPANNASGRTTLDDAIDLSALIREGIPDIEHLGTPTLGEHSFYRVGTALIGGHPKEGKSWLAAVLALDYLTTNPDGVCVVWDFENGPNRYARRLVALAADLDAVGRIRYVKWPQVSLATLSAELQAITEQHPGAMLSIDSLRGFLGKLGLEENDAGDIEKALTPVNEAAEDGGLMVPIIDHVPKDGNSGNRYPGRGSGAKLAVVSAAYYVEKVEPFSKAFEGAIKVYVKADRDGELPELVMGYKLGGGGDRFCIRRVPVSELGDGNMSEAVYEVLRDAPGPLTITEIKKAVKGTDSAKIKAANKMVNKVGSHIHRAAFESEDKRGRKRKLEGFEYDFERDEDYKTGGLDA